MKKDDLLLEEMRRALNHQALLIKMIVRELRYIHEATGTAPHVFYKDELEEITGLDLSNRDDEAEPPIDEEIKADLNAEQKQLLNEMGQAIRDLADLAVDIATVDLADEEEMNRQDCEVERLNRQINELGRRQKKLIRRARLNRISERRANSKKEESQ